MAKNEGVIENAALISRGDIHDALKGGQEIARKRRQERLEQTSTREAALQQFSTDIGILEGWIDAVLAEVRDSASGGHWTGTWTNKSFEYAYVLSDEDIQTVDAWALLKAKLARAGYPETEGVPSHAGFEATLRPSHDGKTCYFTFNICWTDHKD
jgi:hypothetical protein